MNRITQITSLSLLMLASSVALAEGGDRHDRYDNRSNGYHEQSYSRHGGGKNAYRHGAKHGKQHGYNKGYNKGYKQGKKHGKRYADDRYYNGYRSRGYAQYDRNRNRHRHDDRYCNVRHEPGYGARYARPVVLPVPPPVVLFPPRPRFYFGGTIEF